MTEMFETQLGESSTERLRVRDDDEGAVESSTGGAIQLPPQQDEAPSIAYYKCSWCGFTHETERTVRAHITREEDGPHANRNGFLDDIFVQAYDEDGTLIGDMKSPTANLRDPITEANLPDGVSMDSRGGEILKVAIENPQMSEPDIADEVYGADSMSGNNSYVYRVIEKHLSAAAAEKADDPDADDSQQPDQPLTASTRRGLTAEPSDEQVQKPSDEKTYDDLKPAQKVVINEHVKNQVDGLGRHMTEIEDTAGVSTGYGSRIINKYDHLVEQRKAAYESGELDLPDPDAILGDADEDDEDRKSYDDLSPLQQRVIDWGVLDEVDDMGLNKSDIEAKAGASPGYSARTYRNYDYIFDRREDAYRNGILNESHLNTPDKDAFTDSSGDKIPRDEQPHGTSVQDAEAAEDRAEPEDTESEPVVRDDAVSDVRADMEALETSVSTRLEQVTDRLAELEETTGSLRAQMSSIDDQLTAIEASSEGSTAMVVPGERDGSTSVTLAKEDWSTVIRALSNYLPEDEDDLLHEVVVQA